MFEKASVNYGFLMFEKASVNYGFSTGDNR